RLLRVPDEDKVEVYERLGLTEIGANTFVWLEEIIVANLDLLFPDVEVVAAYPFRITRDADLEIKDDEASDLLTNVEEQVELRLFGSVVRLEVTQTPPDLIRDILLRNLPLDPSQMYSVDGPLGLANIMELARLDRPDLKDRLFIPALPGPLAKHFFDAIRQE